MQRIQHQPGSGRPSQRGRTSFDEAELGRSMPPEPGEPPKAGVAVHPGTVDCVFRGHDRTHLECKLRYRFPHEGQAEYDFEAYYFVPQSLRLHSETYAKSALYTDLQSYVRLGVRATSFEGILNGAVMRAREATAKSEGDCIDALRLIPCELRATLEAMDVADATGAPTPADERAQSTAQFMQRLLEELRPLMEGPDPIGCAARWVYEECSRTLEGWLGRAGYLARKRREPAGEGLVAASVALAKERQRWVPGLQSRKGGGRRAVERREFRRHMLKRFSSSVLWLDAYIRSAGTWALELVYAIAASLAMAFALLAALFKGQMESQGHMVVWVVAAIFAYAMKDRLKSLLQRRFSSVVARHFPDRRWRITTAEPQPLPGLERLFHQDPVEVCTMDEQAGFEDPAQLPAGVVQARLRTRKHPLEAFARQETVLYHKKHISLPAPQAAELLPCPWITEILRLDLRRWLFHTDDPKQEIVFVDSAAEDVVKALAPRVYNIAVVYRLRAKGQEGTPFHRLRVVVTRKGIRRVEEIC